MQETRYNCCEFLAFDGVIFQSVIKPFFKMPVFGGPLTSSGNKLFNGFTTEDVRNYDQK